MRCNASLSTAQLLSTHSNRLQEARKVQKAQRARAQSHNPRTVPSHFTEYTSPPTNPDETTGHTPRPREPVRVYTKQSPRADPSTELRLRSMTDTQASIETRLLFFVFTYVFLFIYNSIQPRITFPVHAPKRSLPLPSFLGYLCSLPSLSLGQYDG